MTGNAPAYAGFLCLLIPVAMLFFALRPVVAGIWRRLGQMGRWRAGAAVAVAVAVVGFGGSKPGPTLSNLRLLLAERGGRLSNGSAYGTKSTLVEAMAAVDAATNDVHAAGAILPAVAASLHASSGTVAAAASGERHYLRLRFPRPALAADSNLYVEILRHAVSNGVMYACVWFSVEPNVQPEMRFHFASGTGTNRLCSVSPTASSWPQFEAVGGYDCIRYEVPVPPQLLDSDGRMRVPLQVEPRCALGSPETGEPFDVRGDVVLSVDGQFWTTVTGYRTNEFGTVLYFDRGRLANPPMLQATAEEGEAQ